MTIATQTTLAAVLAKLSADPATQTTLAALLTAVQAATPAGSNSIGTVGLNAGTQAIGTVVNGAGTNYMGQVRLTDGTNNPAVKAASTAAAAADPSLVVAFHPTSPLPAGSAKIGLPAQASKHAATLAATTNATSVSPGSLNLYTVTISNLGAATIYWKLFDKGSAPTVGTDVPIMTIPVAASSFQSIQFGTPGHRLSTGLAYSVTGAITSADATAITAGSLVTLTYA